jgi:uncharacterized protein (TIGR03435 family)
MADMMSAARASGMMVPGGMAGGGGGGDAPRPAEAASEPSGGSIFTAVQQLGLKLDPRKVPLDFLLIDHVEKTPTEN